MIIVFVRLTNDFYVNNAGLQVQFDSYKDLQQLQLVTNLKHLFNLQFDDSDLKFLIKNAIFVQNIEDCINVLVKSKNVSCVTWEIFANAY